MKVDLLPESKSLYLITPADRDYDNFTELPRDERVEHIEPIRYQYKAVSGISEFMQEKLAHNGTFYIATRPIDLITDNEGQFTTDKFIHKEYDQVYQIVIRPNNTYLGYLEELIGVPFVYVPKPRGKWHQTDERIGTDCAELAIYGKRRQGYAIPYGGPIGIRNYMYPLTHQEIYCKDYPIAKDHSNINYKVYYTGADKIIRIEQSGDNHKSSNRSTGHSKNKDKNGHVYLQEGDILHYRSQVSVFYKDQGIVGVLDQEDLIIQAYHGGVKILPIRESPFSNSFFQLLRWNNELPLADEE